MKKGFKHEDILEMIEGINNGMTRSDIATLFDCSENTVYYWLSKPQYKTLVLNRHYKGGAISRNVQIPPFKEETEEKDVYEGGALFVKSRTIELVGTRTGYNYMLSGNMLRIGDKEGNTISIDIKKIPGIIDELRGISEKLEAYTTENEKLEAW